MAAGDWVNMDPAPTLDGGDVQLRAFEKEMSLDAAGNGKAVIIPDDIQNVLITIEPSGGCQAKYQWTNDSVYNVKQDLSVVWYDSDDGLVGSNTPDNIYPCTAIKLVQSGVGSSKMKVRAQ